jgi:O-antigen/teichoic acid export membrane protein
MQLPSTDTPAPTTPTKPTMSGLRKIAGNAASMLTSDAVNRSTTFVLYALIARHLGTHEFGQMSLALTLFYIAQVFALAGVKQVIVRAVAKDRTKTRQYLTSGSVIVVASSLLSIAGLMLFVALVGYSADTAAIILLISVGLFPYTLSAICEAVFQAWERMRYIAYANVPANIAKVVLAFVVLSMGYGLYSLVALLLFSLAAVMVIEWWLMLRHIARPAIKMDLRFSRALVKESSTFLGIDAFIAIMGSVNILLLSKLATEQEVGLYSSANQLMVPLMLVYQGIVLSVYPIMCRRFDTSPQSLKRISEYLIEVLLVLALPIVVGLFFLSDQVLLLLYANKDFVLASEVLRIIIWTSVLTALTNVLGQVLWASLREKVTLRIVIVDGVVGLVFGAILIGPFGLVGAAVAAVLTKIVDYIQHYVSVSRVLPGIRITRLAWKPAVASAGMGVYLALVKDQDLIVTILFSGLLYLGLLFALAAWSSGGLRRLKARYLDVLARETAMQPGIDTGVDV